MSEKIQRDPVLCMLRDMADNPTMLNGVCDLIGLNIAKIHDRMTERWPTIPPNVRQSRLAEWGLKKPPCWLVPPYECPAREGEDG